MGIYFVTVKETVLRERDVLYKVIASSERDARYEILENPDKFDGELLREFDADGDAVQKRVILKVVNDEQDKSQIS